MSAVRASIILLAAMAPAAAKADGGSTTWGLKWNAPPVCIQAAELAERVERRAGRSLFSAQAPRHIEGHLTQTSAGWRVRLTLLDDRGRVLGTRELMAPGAECRAVDERVVLMLSLLIEPFSPRPPESTPPVPSPPSAPPADEPTRAPLLARPAPPVVQFSQRLEVLGDRRYFGGRRISYDHFYQLLGRNDLLEATRARGGARAALFVTGGLSTGAAVTLLIAALAGAGCTSYSGFPGLPGSCVRQEPDWYIASGITGAVALLTFLSGALLSPHPTSNEEDARLAAAYNAGRPLP